MPHFRRGLRRTTYSIKSKKRQILPNIARYLINEALILVLCSRPSRLQLQFCCWQNSSAKYRVLRSIAIMKFYYINSRPCCELIISCSISDLAWIGHNIISTIITGFTHSWGQQLMHFDCSCTTMCVLCRKHVNNWEKGYYLGPQK